MSWNPVPFILVKSRIPEHAEAKSTEIHGKNFLMRFNMVSDSMVFVMDSGIGHKIGGFICPGIHDKSWSHTNWFELGIQGI